LTLTIIQLVACWYVRCIFLHLKDKEEGASTMCLSIRHVVLGSILAALLLSPTLSWSDACVSVPAGTNPTTPCTLDDKIISNPGPDHGGPGPLKLAITFLTDEPLNPGVQFGTATPIEFHIAPDTAHTEARFDIATIDGSASIEDFSFEAAGLNVTNITMGGYVSVDATFTSGPTTLAHINLSPGTPFVNQSFSPVSSGHVVLTLEWTCYEESGCGSVDTLTVRFSELPPTGVPEPATLLLVGFGVGAVGLLRRRKNT
jgi:hypothetical protein